MCVFDHSISEVSSSSSSSAARSIRSRRVVLIVNSIRSPIDASATPNPFLSTPSLFWAPTFSPIPLTPPPACHWSTPPPGAANQRPPARLTGDRCVESMKVTMVTPAFRLDDPSSLAPFLQSQQPMERKRASLLKVSCIPEMLRAHLLGTQPEWNVGTGCRIHRVFRRFRWIQKR